MNVTDIERLATLEQKTGDHGERLDSHDRDIKTLYKALSYRLPLWATFLIAAQTGVIGWITKGGVG